MKESPDRSQLPPGIPTGPLLIVISGSSGVGKDTVLARMRELGSSLKFITTVTTRPQRPNEKNDIDYHFVSTERFQEMIKNKELLEWANVYGNWYGVPREAVKRSLDEGKDTIIKVDIQGAATIKKILPQAIFIFLMPPSMEELLVRLKQRRTESPAELALRLKTAEEEIKQLPLFDYAVTNRWDELDLAVATINSIITAEKCRLTPRDIKL
ncbi:MAG: guanylate kinase [Dehalococcoidales bacterium]|nr:guanylate kinase [Dehalococcoidales bacterium]